MSKFYPFIILLLLVIIAVLGLNHYHKAHDHVSFMNNSNHLIASTSLNKKEIEEVVKEVLKKNPELIIESIRDMNTRKAKDEMERVTSLVKAKTKELEEDMDDPRFGNPNATIKLIEFFDYNCGYCKRMIEIKKKIVEENSDVQIIFKELPILGENSTLASKSALAVNALDQSKYFQYQTELLNVNGPKTNDAIKAIVTKLGLDLVKFNQLMLDSKIDGIIAKNIRLAEEINVNGTPAYILSGEFLPGAVPYEEFKTRIDEERTKKNIKPSSSGNAENKKAS